MVCFLLCLPFGSPDGFHLPGFELFPHLGRLKVRKTLNAGFALPNRCGVDAHQDPSGAGGPQWLCVHHWAAGPGWPGVSFPGLAPLTAGGLSAFFLILLLFLVNRTRE